ncbi:MAG TPA: TerC/Alx family metal homeostasis membrane protein, partial [Phycisphaerales bacterium]|nr:TerC/Alx family metal homeostasis membrane protein [Phycisphaerales bacterium]
MLALLAHSPAAAGGQIPLVPIAIFIGLLLALLALDLGVLNRKAHVIKATEAMLWTSFWVTLALLFGGVVYLAYENHWFGLGVGMVDAVSGQPLASPGRSALVQYVTGYLVEQSLSLDNIFVIATIFAYFRVPGQFQHRVLFWGIIGVIVMRGAMIAGGAALIHAFDWSVYVFGAILFFSAIKMLALNTDNIDIEASLAVRVGRKLFPIHSEYDGQRFFTRVDGKRYATPLFLVLLLVESADAVFALDSIPAIFAITTDPFIVFTSNVFAILGLRSLYFALAAIVHKFKYLKVSLAFLLAYVGVKMVLTHHYKIEPLVSLAIIGGILALGVLASLISDTRGRSGRDGVFGPDVERVTRLTLRQARKLVILVIGATIVLFGLLMLIGPGPGFIVIAVGLAVLATEFIWARHLLGKYHRGVRDIANRADRALGVRA